MTHENKRRYIASSVNRFSAGLPFQQWCTLWTTECLRILKPGGHLLAFGGTRTWHRLTCAVEDAGFEIRDSIAWLYGSGFPKSLDVSKAIDKAAGVERERILVPTRAGNAVRRGEGEQGSTYGDSHGGFSDRSANATPEAEQWSGRGTALKPAFEPVVVARKPLAGTVSANVQQWGTGALNIDASRIATSDHWEASGVKSAVGTAYAGSVDGSLNVSVSSTHAAGRCPANVVLDDSQAAALDQMSGELTSGANPTRRGSDKFRDTYGEFKGQEDCTSARGADSGGASRFFYTAKAGSAERITHNGVAHPTVKPLDLMRWLVRLVTPPGGTVLEPFAGSGTTVEACLREGFRCVAIEREADYLPLILQRIYRSTDPAERATVRSVAPQIEDDLFANLELPA